MTTVIIDILFIIAIRIAIIDKTKYSMAGVHSFDSSDIYILNKDKNNYIRGIKDSPKLFILSNFSIVLSKLDLIILLNK